MDNIEKVNLDASEIRQITIYNNGELAFIENINDIDITRTIQTEFYVMVLVLEGKASVDINGTPYTTYKNDIFVWRGKSKGSELKNIKRHEAPLQKLTD